MFLMLQKTFFASKGTKNLVEYPKPGRDFSTKSRKRSGERRSGADDRTHAARGKKRPAASTGRQTDRERLYAGHVRRQAPATGTGDGHRGRASGTDIGDRHQRQAPGTGKRGRKRGDGKEGTGKRAKPGACGNPPGDRTSPGGGREPRTEEAPHRKEPRPEGTPHKGKPRTNKKKSRTEGTPHKGKPRPRECFARKKSRAEGTCPGDRFAHEKIPRGSGKYQR